MTPEESAALLADKVERREEFALARYGDGDLYFMRGETLEEVEEALYACLGDRPGRPAGALSGGDLWSPKLRELLLQAWHRFVAYDKMIFSDARTILVDWGDELLPYWEELTSDLDLSYVHHYALWLEREPRPELLRFCHAVRSHPGRTLIVGRHELKRAANMILSDFHVVDPYEADLDAAGVIRFVRDYEYDLVLFCAGRGAKLMIAGLLGEGRMLIDAGSLFDPLCLGNTRPRPGDPSDADTEEFFSAVAGYEVRVSDNRPGRPWPQP